MKITILLVLLCLIGMSQSTMKQQNVDRMKQVLSVDYSWLNNKYFKHALSESVVHQSHIYLNNFDNFINNFKYLDQGNKFPVSEKLKNHLIMASLSDKYKTIMFNFKVNKNNQEYHEVLLVTKLYTKNNAEFMQATIIQGQIHAEAMPKYSSYTTKKCECVWYTLCIQNKCTVTTHYVPRAYTSTELSNLEKAMRFRTYHTIIKNCYDNRDRFDFTGLSALTEYMDKMALPPRMDGIQNPLVKYVNKEEEIVIGDQDIIENEDGSVFVEDIEYVMGLFESKKALYQLVQKDSNKYLVKQNIVANINQMSIHPLQEFEHTIKQLTAQINNGYKVAIQYWILNTETDDLKWNIVQVIFNQNQKSVAINITFKTSIENDQFVVLSSHYEHDNSDGLVQDGTIVMKHLTQTDSDTFDLVKSETIQIEKNEPENVIQ